MYAGIKEREEDALILNFFSFISSERDRRNEKRNDVLSIPQFAIFPVCDVKSCKCYCLTPSLSSSRSTEDLDHQDEWLLSVTIPVRIEKVSIPDELKVAQRADHSIALELTLWPSNSSFNLHLPIWLHRHGGSFGSSEGGAVWDGGCLSFTWLAICLGCQSSFPFVEAYSECQLLVMLSLLNEMESQPDALTAVARVSGWSFGWPY